MESTAKLDNRHSRIYGVGSLMRDSWALPATVATSAQGATAPARELALELSGRPYEPYPDDTHRGLDPASLTGTKGAYDPYTGAFGTAGTPVTCGYGMSGSTIGIGYTSGRRLWEEGAHRGATPGLYAYQHGGNPQPACADTQKASEGRRQVSPPRESAPAHSGGILAWLFGRSGATA